MKTVVALFCVLYFVCCGVTADDTSETCLKQMGLTIFDIENLNRDYTQQGIRRRGCFEACLMQKIGLMDGSVINLHKIDEQIDRSYPDSQKKDTIRNSLHKCANRVASDDQCVVARNFAKCGVDLLKFAEFIHRLS